MDASHSFGSVEELVFIGGGETMVAAIRRARALGIATRVVLAPRHAGEAISSAETLEQACRRAVATVEVVEDINTGWADRQDKTVRRLAVCFGPAWIFSKSVRECFGAGMVNYNPIPVPRYLGGAHYTWQILNGDREGGCVLQLITDRLDRGPILDRCSFEIDAGARCPADYALVYHEQGAVLLERFLDGVKTGRAFAARPFDSLQDRRLYLPRLHTASHGYIDWRWGGEEIERFCCAFDAPYMGAGTFLQGEEVRLKQVCLEPGERFHPFLSGLVVARSGAIVWVAVSGGRLRIDSLHGGAGQPAKVPREGDRFLTPDAVLERAKGFRASYTGRGLAG